MAKNWDKYCENKTSKQRIGLSIGLKLTITLILKDCMTCAIFDTNPEIRSFFSNATHLMGNQRIVSTYGALGSSLALMLGLIYNYEELNRKTFVIEFLNSIKNNQNSNRLSSRYSNKFGLQLNIIDKFCINESSNSIAVAIAFILIISSIRAYLDENSNFNLVSMIIWSVHVWKTFTGYGVVMYSVIVYLKYQFLEINESIEISLRNRDFPSLMKAYRNHTEVVKTLNLLNKMYKIVMFQIYFSVSPLIDYTIFIVTQKDTTFYLRLLCSSVGVNCFLMIFVLTYLCAGITKIAHNSRPLLYTFLLKTRLSVNENMRIESFIERLSGPEIGFYCWDLFAMNNREFCDFFFQFIANYILVKLL